MHLAERRGQADGHAQDICDLHRLSNQSIQWLAARVGEYEHRSPLVRCQRESMNGPPGIELRLQRVFVLHPPEAPQCGVFQDGSDRENGWWTRIDRPSVMAPMKQELPIPTKRLERVV